MHLEDLREIVLKLAFSRRSVKESITKSQALDAKKSLKLREKENLINIKFQFDKIQLMLLKSRQLAGIFMYRFIYYIFLNSPATLPSMTASFTKIGSIVSFSG